MPHFSFEVDQLLRGAAARLPLVQSELPTSALVPNRYLKNAAALFPEARHSEAALAGLLLRAGCWAESHSVAQEIETPEGSYWHGIIHRIEPDSFNAGYWFRRVGKHAIFPALLRRAGEVLEHDAPRHWQLKNTWDAFLFIEWCDEAREKRGQAEQAAIEIQMAEWELLFDWCRAGGTREAN